MSRKITNNSERAKYKREWYAEHMDVQLKRVKERWSKLTEEQKQETYSKRRETPGYKEFLERKRKIYQTEEYRAKRRADYAAKHGRKLKSRYDITNPKELAEYDMKKEYRTLL